MEKFSLKWNDFHSNVSKSFGLFRSEEYLQDVTVMSEDYYQVSAHKLVLSACSEHFRNIFKNSKKSNTLICLDGVSKEDLKNILDFIYLGESHIFQDKLDRFLKIAEKLKLEGIMSQGEEKENKQQEEIFNENISKPLILGPEMLSMRTNPGPTNNNFISGPGMPCTLTHPRIDVDKNCYSNKKLHR